MRIKLLPRKIRMLSSVLVWLLLIGPLTMAQNLVSGVVKDQTGTAMPGINVIIKGTTKGTSTDGEGKFSIAANPEDVLVISFIGYKTQELQVGNQTTLNLQMEEDVSTLDEVVVHTGYGEMRKVDVTGAQSTISSKDVARTVNTTIDQAIQGRAPGVYVTQNTGVPGGGVSVNIRGVNSLLGSNEPLYVIDGVQIQGSTSQSGINPLSSVNPADVENIEVLQGPSATAIYGSRGTNGVVLITTKRGKSGDMKISYSYKNSLQARPKNLDIMNLQQYAQMNVDYHTAIGDLPNLRQEFRDPSILGAGTDWQKELFRQASMQQHQLTVSGGSDKSSYYISLERTMQDGVGPNSGYNRTSVRLNLDNKPREWFSFGTNIQVTQEDRKLGTMGVNGNFWNNLILNAVQLAPDIPVKNLDGTYGAGNPNVSTAQQFSPPNPIGLANLVTNNVTTRTLLGGLNLGIKIVDGLEFRTNLNTNIAYNNYTVFYPTYHFSAYQYNNTAVLQNQANYNTSWLWNQMLTYVKDINGHHINAMVTHEAQESHWQNLMGQRQNFPVNNILDLNVGDPNTAANAGGQGPWAMESYLGRVNYNYEDRYIVTAAFRRDGSVNFAPEKKWGNFPSVSAAYRISNEKFFQVSAISDLRLRYEIGITGNQSNYGAIYGTLNSGTSPWGATYSPSKITNPNFGWEETKTINYGLTLGLLKGHIQLDADYYLKYTDNLALQPAYPYYMGTTGVAGIQAPYVNIGTLQNKGWSVSINGTDVKIGPVRWDANLNFSSFKTTITSLAYGTSKFDRILGNAKGNSPFTERSVLGQAPWQFVGNIQQGVFQSVDEATNSARPVDGTDTPFPVDVNNIWVGDAKYKDINGDGKINDQDLTFIGNPWPKWFGGFTNNFSYKGFELSILLTFNYGNQIYNIMRDEEMNPNNINLGRNMFQGMQNFAKVATDQDGNPYLLNPTTNVPRVQGNSGKNNNFGRYTSTYVEDGSYARLKNVSLTYNLPASLISKQKVVRGVRIGVSAQNLYTWTKYSGYDPEVGSYVGQSYGGDNMVGIDYGRYPLTKIYTFSIGVDF